MVPGPHRGNGSQTEAPQGNGILSPPMGKGAGLPMDLFKFLLAILLAKTLGPLCSAVWPNTG